MAYLDKVNAKYAENIINRKEYLISQSTDDPVFSETEVDKDTKHFIPRSYQRFGINYINPNTPINRMYIKFGTGTGKTAMALQIAMNFIDVFRKDLTTHKSVIIIGFTKQIFRRELLKYLEFGFINRDEMEELKHLKERADGGTRTDEEIYNDYISIIRRRITNARRGGLFQFYGYREFVNRVFTGNISNMSEDEIHKKITSGDIKLNEELISTFRDSIIICDEIHNVYNSLDKNNWGIAIQAVLNYHKEHIRAIFLSATPINHSPTEVVDLLNLLNIDKTFKKSDFFNDTSLKSNALKEIGDAFAGKVLFLEDANPAYYPSTMIRGESITGISLLKFIRCPMSDLNLRAYNSIDHDTIPQESQYIMDFTLPSPEGVGIFRSSDIKILAEADSAFMKKNNIEIIKDKSGIVISGEFMNYKTIGNYSKKYEQMLTDIFDIIRNQRGKVFIYHRYVRMSGILFIKEMLMRNGILDEYSDPTDNTYDVLTGMTFANHKKTKAKTPFHPVRLITIYADIDAGTRDKSIEKFNSPANADGREIMIIIGAEVIKESYELKCVREVMIMSKPDNISTLVQIFGRANRQRSHIDLPIEKRTVTYRIYVASTGTKTLSYEETKYKERVDDYILIQQIERAIHENAVDGYTNNNIIQRAIGTIGILPYKPKFTPRTMITTTFDVFYRDDEIKLVIFIIKRLFTEHSKIYTFDDIVKDIHNPPFRVEYKTSLIDNDTIYIALYLMLYEDDDKFINTIPKSTSKYWIDRLYDIDKVLLINDVEFIICPFKEYYILCQYNRANNTIIIEPESIYRDSMMINNTLPLSVKYYLQHDINEITYTNKREIFRAAFYQSSLREMRDVLCKFTVDFHKTFIEEAIKYVIHRLNGDIKEPSEYELFFTKMIMYYDMMDIIITYDTARDYVRETYNFLFKKKPKTDKPEVLRLSKMLSHIVCEWCPPETVNKYFHDLVVFRQSIKTGTPSTSVLPIGYTLSTTPRFYHPEKGWYDATDYIKDNTKYVENDYIIGYRMKTQTGLYTRFKLRPPVQKQIYKADGRHIERGFICTLKQKDEVIDIVKKLKIPYDADMNVASICDAIKSKLMYLELLERKKGSNVRYFYDSWEQQPI